MSTILEALKKSEQERKLNDLPTLSDMPPPQERSNLFVVLMATACVLLVLVLVLLSLRWWQQLNESGDAAIIDNAAVGAPVAVSQPVADEIIVNVVSFADDPAQRFVMIDGKLAREGEFVRAGLRVERIEPNAVILNLRGKRIKRTP